MAKAKGAKSAAAKTASAKEVTVGTRRIAAEFSSNLEDVLPGDFTIMDEFIKGDQSWIKIGLSDGQVLLVAGGDLLDMHIKGAKVFDGKPVEGQKCPLREGLKIGIKAKKIQFA